MTQEEVAVNCFAPAKLNLFLEILNRRNDGFHNVETVTALISLRDSITLKRVTTGLTHLTCHFDPGTDEQIPIDDRNLVLQAVHLLSRTVNRELPVAIELHKRIPSGAGLGGGSSDAAATLIGMNRLFQLNLPKEELIRLAAELGSDVPLFLLGPLVFGQGRGEIVEEIQGGVRGSFVIIKPEFNLATPEVYRKFDELPAEHTRSVEPLLNAIRFHDGAAVNRACFNRLEKAAFILRPELVPLLEILQSANVLHAQMTGSGSALFALCSSNDQALVVAEQMRIHFPTAFVTTAELDNL